MNHPVELAIEAWRLRRLANVYHESNIHVKENLSACRVCDFV